MPYIHDSEFGEVVVRRSARSKHIRLRVAPNGTLRISAPLYTPMMLVKRFLKQSHSEIRMLIENQENSLPRYEADAQIGKSHHLLVEEASASETAVEYKKPHVIVYLAENDRLDDPGVTMLIRPVVIKALRNEAKAYLPRRLAYFSNKFGFTYEKVRFSHAGSRWGSCSTSGTISLNIALMKLPFELIDYVLIHELCHTKEMNHSADFWHLVAMCDPNYKEHRKAIRDQHPHL